ncbi:hypothetical protein K503DRAFT_807191 [Rhizopogon vinicolor AM-OR11-026]|uniref:Uncharacterized protein n=1 Tax=Rhizopogon vinicolor AM-OR11-026 TaxID=1314800 RepID=A0A1B7MD25_9AGAM|nr:hypothetical protein K503DRAFT_807191 [Rhizopogon vinicolor AM-OR11-026]
MRRPKRVHSIWAANLKSKKMKTTEGHDINKENAKQVDPLVWQTPGWLMGMRSAQPLYFPDGHEKAGYFKGMAQILVERGYANAPRLPAECRDFNRIL